MYNIKYMNIRRPLVYILTIVYSILVISGIIFLIAHSTSFDEVFVDVVALVISGTSILVALLSQIAADRERTRLEQMIQEIDLIDENLESDLRADRSVQHRLTEILELDRKIYRKLGGRTDAKKPKKP